MMNDLLATRKRERREFEARLCADPERTRGQIEKAILNDILPGFEKPLVDRVVPSKHAIEVRERTKDNDELSLEDALALEEAETGWESIEGIASDRPPRRPNRGALFHHVYIELSNRFPGITQDYTRAVLNALEEDGRVVRTTMTLRSLPFEPQADDEDVWRLGNNGEGGSPRGGGQGIRDLHARSDVADDDEYRSASWFHSRHGISRSRISEKVNEQKVRSKRAPRGQQDGEGREVRKLYRIRDVLQHCQTTRKRKPVDP